MKQPSVNYQTQLGRSNLLKIKVLGFFFSITSHPRLLLEVFVRKGFGRGYFSLASALSVLIPNLIFPVMFYMSRYDWTLVDFITRFATWYIAFAAFAYKSWMHYLSIRMKPGEYDFSKYSKFAGYQDERFFTVKLLGIEANTRNISTIYEPGFFLIIGIVLSLMAQPIGYLIAWCSVLYSLGYFGAYHMGHLYILDIFDKMIIAEQLQKTCVDGRYPDDDKGFEMFDMPKNPEYRRRMANHMMGREEPLRAR